MADKSVHGSSEEGVGSSSSSEAPIIDGTCSSQKRLTRAQKKKQVVEDEDHQEEREGEDEAEAPPPVEKAGKARGGGDKKKKKKKKKNTSATPKRKREDDAEAVDLVGEAEKTKSKKKLQFCDQVDDDDVIKEKDPRADAAALMSSSPNYDKSEEEEEKREGKSAAVVVGELGHEEGEGSRRININSSSSSSKKKGGLERVWSEEDELMLLQLLANYKETTGLVPSPTSPSLMEFLRSSSSSENNSNGDAIFLVLKNEFTQQQVYNKIRTCKGKFRKYMKNKNLNLNQKKLFDLLCTVWGKGKSEEQVEVVSSSSDNNNNNKPLSVLEEWFFEGLGNVESPEERQQLVNKWNKCKIRFNKTRHNLLQLSTYVSTKTLHQSS